MIENLKTEFSFWQWWFRYGVLKLIDWWLIFHLFLGILLTILVPLKITDVAFVVVIPLVGVLIGLSFAWLGNAIALLDSSEIQKMSKYHERGIKEYIYSYQASLLILLICIISWTLLQQFPLIR